MWPFYFYFNLVPPGEIFAKRNFCPSYHLQLFLTVFPLPHSTLLWSDGGGGVCGGGKEEEVVEEASEKSGLI